MSYFLVQVSSVLLLLGSLNFRIPVNNRYASAHGMVVFVSRRLLQVTEVKRQSEAQNYDY